MERDVVLGLDLRASSFSIVQTREMSREMPKPVLINGAPYVSVALAFDTVNNRVAAFGAEALSWKGDTAVRVFSDFIEELGQTKFYQVKEVKGRNKDSGNIRANEMALAFLTAVRQDIEQHFFNGAKLTDFVSRCALGLPMGISESEIRKEALRQVLAQAGFPNVILCPNPIAAGCYLQFSGAVPPEAKQNVMVYDLDSLSSSAAIVRVEPQKLPVLEGWSEQPVGGRRFLDLLFDHFKRKIESENTESVFSQEDNAALRLGIARLLRSPIGARWAEGQSAEVEISLFEPERSFRLSLSLDEYQDICREPIGSFVEPILKVLKASDISPEHIADNISMLFIVGDYAYLPHAVTFDRARIQNIPSLVSEKAPLVLAKGLALFAQKERSSFSSSFESPSALDYGDKLKKMNRRRLWQRVAAVIVTLLVFTGAAVFWDAAFRLKPSGFYAVFEVEQGVYEHHSFDPLDSDDPNAEEMQGAHHPYCVVEASSQEASSQWAILGETVRLMQLPVAENGGRPFAEYEKSERQNKPINMKDMPKKVSDPVLRLYGFLRTNEALENILAEEGQKVSWDLVVDEGRVRGVRVSGEGREKLHEDPKNPGKTRIAVFFREKRYYRTASMPIKDGKGSLFLPEVSSQQYSSKTPTSWFYPFERGRRDMTLKCVRVLYEGSSIETTHWPGSRGVVDVVYDRSSRKVEVEFKESVRKRWASENADRAGTEVEGMGRGLPVWTAREREAGK